MIFNADKCPCYVNVVVITQSDITVYTNIVILPNNMKNNHDNIMAENNRRNAF